MSQRPFQATPVAAVYVPMPAIETARQTIARSIERAEGPALVLGPAGTGKSLLLARLGADFAERFDGVMLAGGRLRTVRALLQNILFELKLPFRDRNEGELRLSLLDRLEPGARATEGLLLLVDEAHVLPGRLLDELRMITNLVRGGQPRVRLVLAGDVRLEERLANPRLASFQQRVAARCYLQSLQRDETSQYIARQFEFAGVDANTFVDETGVGTIHRLSDGVPRLINQLCDHALILAQLAGERTLSAERLEEAWADLQQLPAASPVRRDSGATAGASVVEFGPLEDTPDRLTRVDLPGHDVRERHPLEQIEAIEQQLTAAQQDDFEPLALKTPEYELTFQSTFGGDFDEEEVVIDRYASLESQTLWSRPQVTSSEGRAIATLMGAVSPARRQLGIVSIEAPQNELFAEAFEDPFDPAADPVMPEYGTGVSTNVAVSAAHGLHPELVVVDSTGAEHPAPAQDPPGRAHRQEYRQLFAKLRRGG